MHHPPARPHSRAAGPVLAALMAAATVPAMASDGPPEGRITGLWATEPRESGAYITVRIRPCRSSPATRCGVVAGAHGGARPDIVGEPILTGLEHRGEGHWGGGEIIRPGTDERYRSEIRRVAEGLEVKGCALVGLVCRTQIWRPAR